MKPCVRDYVDFFCIVTQQKYSLDKLWLDAKDKFDWHIDKLTLASQFLRAGDFEDYPKMLIPFKKPEMIDFYDSRADQLKKEIIK